MLYSIKILQGVIDQHQKEIDKLKKVIEESLETTFFEEEEIKEREDYIKQVSEAIQKLSEK